MSLDLNSYQKIRNSLMQWYQNNRRRFPWRIESIDPFHVIVAEIFLRQTRAVVVERVYKEFIIKFPTPRCIVQAPERSLMEVMKPLGITSRVEQIKELAKLIETKFQGKLPSDKGSLKMMPGVGEYTAAAVRIFAFNEHDVLIDTNIMRVISRLFGLRNTEEVKTQLRYMSENENIRDFYYMLIDFGSVICKAINPFCGICPVWSFCKNTLDSDIAAKLTQSL